MSIFSCRNCGSTENDRYEDSEWCVPCVGATIAEQDRARYAPEQHEIIDPLVVA